jgi:hypothetical protein
MPGLNTWAAASHGELSWRALCPNWPVQADQDRRFEQQPLIMSMPVAYLGGGTFYI